jgi:hypothetical protein
MISQEEVNYRFVACKNCNCGVDKNDPCSSCPKKRWGPDYVCGSDLFPQEQNLSNSERKYPSMVEMVRSIAVSAKQEAQSILSGKEPVSKEEHETRYKTCESCEFFVAKSKRCYKCGCYMPIKTTWRSQKCPIGKW